MKFLNYVDESTKEEIIKEWFFSDDKPKKKKTHKLNHKTFATKAVAELKKRLNLPENKDLKDKVKLKVPNPEFTAFCNDDSEEFCFIGEYYFPYTDDGSFSNLIFKLDKICKGIVKDLGDPDYKLDPDEDCIYIYDNLI